MRIVFLIFTMLTSGCEADVQLIKLQTNKRVRHESGVSVMELKDTKLFDLGENFALNYPAERKGRSTLSIGVSSMNPSFGSEPKKRFTRATFNLSSFEQIDDTTWLKAEDIVGGKRRRKDIQIVRDVNGRWVLLDIMSTVDLENVREFSLQFAQSIEVSD